MRAQLLAALCAVLGLVLPSLATAGPTAAAAVALLVLVAAVHAVRVLVPLGVLGVLPVQSRAADEDRSLGTERATDPVHSPLRPRAPGLV